ncbi:hypothetical protein B0H13DRAFT_1931580 [Mycena leptocephala]|nr:hypothetical protein B0H13DRAFT_1931580 [Mycena leptocephala]
MPTIPDVPFSVVGDSALPITATSIILAAFVTPAVAAAAIHYVSPQRLTEVLIAALSKAENTYVDVLQMGLLSATETEVLYTLQRKVSAIHVATMRDSLSWRAGLQGFFKGRTLTVLSCIREVQGFETQIKILKEAHLRESNLNPLCTRAVSLDFRRRCHGAGHVCCLYHTLFFEDEAARNFCPPYVPLAFHCTREGRVALMERKFKYITFTVTVKLSGMWFKTSQSYAVGCDRVCDYRGRHTHRNWLAGECVHPYVIILVPPACLIQRWCSLLGREVRNCIQTSSTHVLSTQDAHLKHRPATAFRDSIGVHHDYLQQIRFAAVVQELKGKRFKPVPGLSTNLRPIAQSNLITIRRRIATQHIKQYSPPPFKEWNSGNGVGEVKPPASNSQMGVNWLRAAGLLSRSFKQAWFERIISKGGYMYLDMPREFMHLADAADEGESATGKKFAER